MSFPGVDQQVSDEPVLCVIGGLTGADEGCLQYSCHKEPMKSIGLVHLSVETAQEGFQTVFIERV